MGGRAVVDAVGRRESHAVGGGPSAGRRARGGPGEAARRGAAAPGQRGGGQGLAIGDGAGGGPDGDRGCTLDLFCQRAGRRGIESVARVDRGDGVGSRRQAAGCEGGRIVAQRGRAQQGRAIEEAHGAGKIGRSHEVGRHRGREGHTGALVLRIGTGHDRRLGRDGQNHEGYRNQVANFRRVAGSVARSGRPPLVAVPREEVQGMHAYAFLGQRDRATPTHGGHRSPVRGGTVINPIVQRSEGRIRGAQGRVDCRCGIGAGDRGGEGQIGVRSGKEIGVRHG